jgi:ankyrin repeat protein
LNLLKKTLSENGADITIQDKDGYTAFDRALLQSYYISHSEIVRYLINNGANFNAQITLGLVKRKLRGRNEVAALLKKYIRLEEQIKETQPTQALLQEAIEEDFVPLVKLLLISGIIPNQESWDFAKDRGSKVIGRLMYNYLRLSNANLGIAKEAYINLPKELSKKVADYTLYPL